MQLPQNSAAPTILAVGKKQDWKRCYKRAINTQQLHGTWKNIASCDALQNQTQAGFCDIMIP